MINDPCLLLLRMPADNQKDRQQRFKHYRGQVVECPLVEISVDFTWSEQRMVEFQRANTLFFTSKYGVRLFFHLCFEQEISQQTLAHYRYVCIGEQTKKAILEVIAPVQEVLVANDLSAVKMEEEWLAKSASISSGEWLWISGNLSADVRYPNIFTQWRIYQNQAVSGYEQLLISCLKQHKITDVFVSSPSIFKRFYEVANEYLQIESLRFFVLGETTTKAIQLTNPKIKKIQEIR